MFCLEMLCIIGLYFLACSHPGLVNVHDPQSALKFRILRSRKQIPEAPLIFSESLWLKSTEQEFRVFQDPTSFGAYRFSNIQLMLGFRGFPTSNIL